MRTLDCRYPRFVGMFVRSLGMSLAIFLATPWMLTAQTTGLKSPPIAAVRPVTDGFFGIKVIDPYRYMEDMANPEVAAWFKAQNDHARAVLARIPGRRELLAQVKLLDDSVPIRISDVRRFPGEVYFYQKQLTTEEVARLYTRTRLDGAERLLVDPTKYQTPGGPHYSINYYAPRSTGPTWLTVFRRAARRTRCCTLSRRPRARKQGDDRPRRLQFSRLAAGWSPLSLHPASENQTESRG